MEGILLENGETVEIMDYEEWEAKHEEERGCVYSRWQFETNGDCDYEDYCDDLYNEYVEEVIKEVA